MVQEKTIQLSDDWFQSAYGPDAPMGYAVPDGTGEHRVFANIDDAELFADEVDEEHPEHGEVLIYPLLAAPGRTRSNLPRSWR